MMLARRADPKSKEKWWILSVSDFLIRAISQFTMSCYMKAGMIASLTEHFCSRARQKRWITEPFSCSLRILMDVSVL